MSSHASIQFLQHNEIDKKSYDDCVLNSPNSLIYAHSFYLDHVSPNWATLAAQDYSWVMPVTCKQKWGIGYLYQPAFTQQLGVFAKEPNRVPWQEIVEALKKKYSFWEINVNYLSPSNFLRNQCNVIHATNYILPLHRTYEEICADYHKDLVKNIKRSKKFGLIYRDTHNYTSAVDIYINHYSSRMKHVTTLEYQRFKSLCSKAVVKEMLLCREVVNDANELMAIALILKDDKRLYNLMNTTTAAGRKVEANHFLFDCLIKEYAGAELILDFEGSDLPGVKVFYENFGSINQPYYKLTYNNLPWPIKLLK